MFFIGGVWECQQLYIRYSFLLGNSEQNNKPKDKRNNNQTDTRNNHLYPFPAPLVALLEKLVIKNN